MGSSTTVSLEVLTFSQVVITPQNGVFNNNNTSNWFDIML